MAGNREISGDTLRGLALIMVMCIHVTAHTISVKSANGDFGSTFWFAHFFNAFSRVCVPIFVLLSGRYLLAKQESWKIFYKNRLSRIFFIALFWGSVYELYALFTGKTPTILQALYNILTAQSSDHLWFIYMLIGLYALTPFIQKKCLQLGKRQLWLVGCTLCVFGLFLSAYDSLTPGPMPFLLWCLKYIGYFILGFAISKTPLHFSRSWLIGLYILCSSTIYFGTYFTIKNGQDFLLYGYVTPFVMIGSIALYWFITSGIYSENFFSKLAPFVLGIYLLHPLFLDIINSILSTNFSPIYSHLWYILVLKFFGILSITYISIFFLSKVKRLKVLFT